MHHACPYDQISVLTNFDQYLKYVTIDVDCKGLEVHGEAEASTSSAGLHRNAFELLMQPTTRPAPKYSVDKPRFTGTYMYI